MEVLTKANFQPCQERSGFCWKATNSKQVCFWCPESGNVWGFLPFAKSLEACWLAWQSVFHSLARTASERAPGSSSREGPTILQAGAFLPKGPCSSRQEPRGQETRPHFPLGWSAASCPGAGGLGGGKTAPSPYAIEKA